MSRFGDRLRALRKSRHMSQEALAKLLSTSKQVISRYENNMRVPNLDIAVEYAKKLNVPLEYLIDNNVEIEKPATDNDDGLDEKRKEWLSLYEKIPENRRAEYAAMLEAALKSQGLI